MGFNTVALARGKEKEALALKLGARHYLDTNAETPSDSLRKLGGAQIILATAPDAKSISALVGGLAPGGKLVIVGAAMEPLTISALDLIGGRRAIQGWPSGTAMDSQDTLRFSALSGVRPMIEKFPLAKVSEAYERMASGKARFRAVLTME
jgi:D-arabinose 1-dehydrogenase-like Zn-dependent alcohol dehydrogenase